jgi:peptide deformylase
MPETNEGDRKMELAKSDRGWMAGVAGEGIATIGDPRLKVEAKKIGDVHDVADLLALMVQRLRELNGAGLAAPQLGVSVQVIVVEVRKTDVFPDRPTSPLLQMINPVIVQQSEAIKTGWEGCFSVPGLMGLVPRVETITVEYTSTDGSQVTEQYTGYVARVIQHEIDHLNGVEFVDRMTSMESLTTVANYLEFHR